MSGPPRRPRPAGGRAIPLAWLAPPGRSLPEALPSLSDLAPAEPGAPRLAVLAGALPRREARAAAARLAALPGCVEAGWVEADRVAVWRSGRTVTLVRRVAGRWVGGALPPGAASALAAARLRLRAAGRRDGH